MITLQTLGPSEGCSPQQDVHTGPRCPLHSGSNTTPTEYLSAAQVQRELGLSRAQLHELITSGRLPAFQLLGHWRIERRMLHLMIDELYEASARALDVPCLHAGEPDASSGRMDRPRTPRPTVEGPSLRAEDEQPPRWSDLTEHQRQIATLVSSGMSNAEIADRLSLEVSTVKSHVSRILQRMTLRDREQLIVAAWRSGFMPDAVKAPCENAPDVPSGVSPAV